MNEGGGITVTRLNMMIAEAIRREPRIHSLSVKGEISGFRHHVASGHWYFSLKDAESSVSCVMFRQNTFHARIRPKDGDSVIVQGYVDVYPKNGTYQLYATGMSPDGTGDLYARLEELKRRLSAEGLFDPARKRVLPLVPRKVAVVTSGSGAAWHDILNVSGMRAPSVPIVLIPVTVQGEKAAAEIAAGIRTAAEKTDADVMIVARGGGSAEDLWCFNDEAVARAVAESRIPVVSGVGHEIDTTICDLAADVRASTPSNAAEIVFPDRKELRGRVEKIRLELKRRTEGRLAEIRAQVRQAALGLTAASPERRLARLTSESRLNRERLNNAVRLRLNGAEARKAEAGRALTDAVNRRREKAETTLIRIRERLEAINPLGVLQRGYAMVTDLEDRVLTGAQQARDAAEIRIRFANGSVEASVRKEEVPEHE